MSNVEIKVYGAKNKIEELKVKRVAMKIYDLVKGLSWAYAALEDHESLENGKRIMKPEYVKYWDVYADIVKYYDETKASDPNEWNKIYDAIPGFFSEDDVCPKLAAYAVANAIYNRSGLKRDRVYIPRELKMEKIFGVEVPMLKVTVL